MTTSRIDEDIKIGISNRRLNSAEYGKINGTEIPTTPWTQSNHPNNGMELAVMRTFKVTRQTMDKRQGSNGFIILNIQAVSGAQAGTIADEMVCQINTPFASRERTVRN